MPNDWSNYSEWKMPGRISGAFCLSVGVLLSGCGKSDVAGDPSKLVVASEEQPAEPMKNPQPVGKDAPKTIPAPAAGNQYQFPDDEGGKILGKTLPPAAPARLPPPSPQQPIERKLPPSLSNPEVPFSNDVGPLPRLPQIHPAAPKPTPLPDRVPFEMSRIFPDLPAKLVMPEGALTKIEAPDLRRPVDLPILARPTPDRASLEDPTADYSTSSVSAAALPLRQTTAPFVKVNLPDPFENAEAAKSRTPLTENPVSVLGTPQLPKPQLK
jgi:hypothetical protein